MTVAEALSPLVAFTTNVYISEKSNVDKPLFIGTNRTIYSKPDLLKKEVYIARLQGDKATIRLNLEIVIK